MVTHTRTASRLGERIDNLKKKGCQAVRPDQRALWVALVEHTSASSELHICAHDRACGADRFGPSGLLQQAAILLTYYATLLGAALRIADSVIQCGELADIEVEVPLKRQH